MVSRAIAVVSIAVSIAGCTSTIAAHDRAMQGRAGGPDPLGWWATLAFLAVPYPICVVCALAARRRIIPATVVLGGCAFIALVGWNTWRANDIPHVGQVLLLMQTWCYQILACSLVVAGGLQGLRESRRNRNGDRVGESNQGVDRISGSSTVEGRIVSNPHLLSGLAVALLCCGCSTGLDREGASILRDATRVEVFRIDGDKPDTTTGETFAGYPVLGVGKEQEAVFARRLAEVMLGPGFSPLDKKCGIQPGVGFRVWRGEQSVEILVCFRCDVVSAYRTQVPKNERELQAFSPIRPKLLALCKEALPDDAVIQGLPERPE
jgi:hypothetical protein